MKKISELIECDLDLDIFGVSDDSRSIKDGFIFVCTKGYNVDHFDYIDDAINNGAVFLIVDRDIDFVFPHIIVDNINEYYHELCLKFYDLNLNDLSFIGITGTDGKTTTTSIIKQLLDNNYNTTLIGTNGAIIGDVNYKINNTTPCISELYNVLNISCKEECKNIVMEVSSESLLHQRVNSLRFKVVGFTNITEDHLNIHKTLENYINSKLKLIDLLDEDGVCIINGDDNNLKSIKYWNMVSYGFNDSNDCRIEFVKETDKFTVFNISYLDNIYTIKSPFMGLYNIYNVTLAFLVCLNYGLTPEYLVDSICKLKVIPGRREYLHFGQSYQIILDYAHTYNGIINIVSSIDKSKRIIVVTGCAGGREKSKRNKIGKYLLDNCDLCIFTMDDPRYENVNDIIDDMVRDCDSKYLRIIDRKEAIYKAFDLADSDSVVLILGKGRDDYMAVKDKRISYSDYDVISSYFS